MVKHAASINLSSAVVRLRPALVECERNWSELKCVAWWWGCARGEMRNPAGSYLYREIPPLQRWHHFSLFDPQNHSDPSGPSY